MDQRKRAAHLDAAGKCIACESNKPPRKRGLCNKCYQRYRTNLTKLEEAKRAQYTALLVDRGYLMGDRSGQTVTQRDVFAAIADAVSEAADEYEMGERVDDALAATQAQINPALTPPRKQRKPKQ